MKAQSDKSIGKGQVNVQNNDGKTPWVFEANVPVKGGNRQLPKSNSGGKFPPSK